MPDVGATPTDSQAKLAAAYRDALYILMPGVIALLPDSSTGRGIDIRCSAIEDFDFHVEQLGDTAWMFEHVAGMMARRLVRRIAEAAWPGCRINVYPLSVDPLPSDTSTFRCTATALVEVAQPEVRFRG